MAVNRVRNAFAPPKKGETFELRAGLVYVVVPLPPLHVLTVYTGLNMPMKGNMITSRRMPVLTRCEGRSQYKRPSWQ